MKTLLIICAVFLFLGETQAKGTLEEAVQDLDYALSVEWDQADQDFYHQQETLFVKRLKHLKQHGLTNSEVAHLLSQKIKDQNVAQDVQNFFDLINTELLTQEELSYHLRLAQSLWTLQGASWNGSIVGMASLATLVVITSAVMVTTPLFQLY